MKDQEQNDSGHNETPVTSEMLVAQAREALDKAILEEDAPAGLIAWLRLRMAQSDFSEAQAQQHARRLRRRLAATAMLFTIFFTVVFATLGFLANKQVDTERFALRLEASHLNMILAQKWHAQKLITDLLRIEFTDLQEVGAEPKNGHWPPRNEAIAIGQFELVELFMPAETVLRIETRKLATKSQSSIPVGTDASRVQLEFSLQVTQGGKGAVLNFVANGNGSIAASDGSSQIELAIKSGIWALATPSNGPTPRVIVTAPMSEMRLASDYTVWEADFLNLEGKSSLLSGNIYAVGLERETNIEARDRLAITLKKEQGPTSLAVRVEGDRLFVDWTVVAREMTLHSPGRPERNLMPTMLDRLAAQISIISVFWTFVASFFGVALWAMRSWWTWRD